MYKKSCFCGKSEKNFFINIGPKFHGECCEKAGIDHKGNKKASKVEETPKEESPVKEESVIEKLKEETSKLEESLKKDKKKKKK